MWDIKEFIIDKNESLVIHEGQKTAIGHLIIDSRDIMYAANALFFAIKGNVRDGHDFVGNAYAQGVRNFVVSNAKVLESFQDVNYILTDDVVGCMQRIAAMHRSLFKNIKIIAITGSNGKTVVKEWLSILLSRKYNVVKTPGSFNSQIGVPLSVWAINEDHEVGIFEAGISKVDEMDKLEQIIQPQLGILTNLGDAHAAGFANNAEKLKEKLLLFKHCSHLVFNGDDDKIYNGVSTFCPHTSFLSWGYKSHNSVLLLNAELTKEASKIQLRFKEKIHTYSFSSTNNLFFENLMHCITMALHLGIDDDQIDACLADLDAIEMRLSLAEGRDGSLIVNDSYTNDRNALIIALSFLEKHAGNRKKIILLSELELDASESHQNIVDIIKKYHPHLVIFVGEQWKNLDLSSLDFEVRLFDTTESVLSFAPELDVTNAIVLIKGQRKYHLEDLHFLLTRQSHSVALQIDLGAIEHNLSAFASLLHKDTRIMPIIKASAYGAGSEEIAKVLQHKGVYALGVAFADEGIQLRKAGITLPIVVLNADAQSFQSIYDYKLEMEVYSLTHLSQILSWKNGLLTANKIHLKLDTGMSRLGFRDEDLEALSTVLRQQALNIASIFSHLSSSEDPHDDDFSHLQAQRFEAMYERLCTVIGSRPKRHLLNSSGIIRFPEYHYELVRLGLGLYGIDSTDVLKNKLEKVHTLVARIIQTKWLQPNDYIGYNRRHKVEKAMKIGILNIGYADGFMRACGNGNYAVMCKGQEVKIVGSVCMDLSMIDLTEHTEAVEGDEVIIFGKEISIEVMADACKTIPYEILCRIAPRIKRQYVR